MVSSELISCYDDFIMMSYINKDGIIEYISKRFCDALGFNQNELKGEYYTKFRDIQSNGEIFYTLEKKLKNNETISIEKIINFSKKSEVYFTKTFFIPIFKNNIYIGYRTIDEDVSDKIKLEFLNEFISENFDELNNELSQKKEEVAIFKNSIIAVFTHELKTPLNAIINFSDYISRNLKKEIDDKKKLKLIELSNKINSNGKIQLDMINTLLDLVKLKAGKVIANKEEFYLKNILTPIIERYKNNSTREVEINIENKPIYADKKIFQTIFTNLYSNAIKYSKSKICITFNIVDEDYVFTIEDDGAGIDDERIVYIFDMFTQNNVNILNRGQSKSTGLGLHTVKLLVELCEKEIKVDNSPLLGGARFIITKKDKND